MVRFGLWRMSASPWRVHPKLGELDQIWATSTHLWTVSTILTKTGRFRPHAGGFDRSSAISTKSGRFRPNLDDLDRSWAMSTNAEHFTKADSGRLRDEGGRSEIRLKKLAQGSCDQEGAPAGSGVGEVGDFVGADRATYKVVTTISMGKQLASYRPRLAQPPFNILRGPMTPVLKSTSVIADVRTLSTHFRASFRRTPSRLQARAWRPPVRTS